jgi:hypothetical protein
MSNKYKFEHDGTTYEIPLFKDVPVGLIRRSRKLSLNEMEQTFYILENFLGEDTPAINAVDAMSLEQFQEWLNNWTQGVAVGESSGS